MSEPGSSPLPLTKRHSGTQSWWGFGGGGPGLLIAIILCWLAPLGHAQSATEYQVKAAYLYNFAKFVEWPTDELPAADTVLQICVLGQDPFGPSFELMIAGKTVNGHRIGIMHPSSLRQAKDCQILYVAASGKSQLQAILSSVRGASILTVGDSADFAKMGGIVNFILDDGRVRFEINVKAAERAHLKVNARLLTVAKLVSDEGILETK